MSTRYVWEQWNTESKYRQTGPTTQATGNVPSSLYTINDRFFGVFSSVTFSETGGRYDANSNRGSITEFNYKDTISQPFSIKNGEYFDLGWRYSTTGDIVYWENDTIFQATSNMTVTVHMTGGNRPYISLSTSCKKYSRESYKDKGDSIRGYVSSSSSSAYPQDGVSGSYWYDYQGSDNIDPTAISIPSSIMGGSQIALTVTPGTGKVYSGNVSYQFEVKLDNGSWTSVGTTSSTSINYTVPSGTNTIQARARAQDNIGFISNDYVTSSSENVTNNLPPTAPSSITATNLIKNQQATVTWTAATDSDGTIASYTVQRKINGGAFTTIYTGNALTYTDSIGDWATVQYQVQATDDDGATSSWTQSTSYTVQSGFLVINGPAYDMGEKSLPFQFSFSFSISGVEATSNVTTTVTLDGEQVFNTTVQTGTAVNLNVDTRFLSSGEHSLVVNGNDSTYTPVTGTYTFTVPYINIPDGGRIELLQNPEGDAVYPVTLARCVVTADGQDVVTELQSMYALLNAILGVNE